MLILEKDQVHAYTESKFQDLILEGPISTELVCMNSLTLLSWLEDSETVGVLWLTLC